MTEREEAFARQYVFCFEERERKREREKRSIFSQHMKDLSCA